MNTSRLSRSYILTALTCVSTLCALLSASSSAALPPLRDMNPPEAFDSNKVPAVKLANAWIDALRHRDIEALAQRSGYPFALRDTLTEAECVSCTLPEPRQLRFAIRCLTENFGLHEDLQTYPDIYSQVIAKGDVPRWARRWLKELKPSQSLVHIAPFGNGVTYYLILLVGTDRVEGLWKYVTFDPD